MGGERERERERERAWSVVGLYIYLELYGEESFCGWCIHPSQCNVECLLVLSEVSN